MNPMDELIALCQSQVNLLIQGLAAEWVAVYLAEDWAEDRPANLVPLVIYPQSSVRVNADSPITVLPQMWEQWIADRPRLSFSAATQNSKEIPAPLVASASALAAFVRNPAQVVLPLIYQGFIVGLLVVGRRDRDWQGQEMTQLEGIAETLAIACLLDRRQLWYKQQLQLQLTRREVEQNRLEDLLHQLRNPLTAIKTFSKLLRRYLIGNTKGQSVADGLLRESDRLEDLLKQFESQQRERVGEETLTPGVPLLPACEPVLSLDLENVNLSSLIAPILNSAEAIAQEKGIQLTQDDGDSQSLVRANPVALTEALTNLIDNAIKYTPNGGKVTVDLGFRREIAGISYLGLEIRDTGYGIPLADQAQIFERHYRGCQAGGSIPGTGLGLAIVREAIEQMQGGITLQSPNPYLQSSDYPGTCFTLWLAIADPDC